MAKCYLDCVPKDVIGIIFRFLYDVVVDDIKRHIPRFKHKPILMLGFNTPRSSKCMICGNIHQTQQSNNLWSRNTRWPYKRVCDHLLFCQTKPGNWSGRFDKRTHLMSIINGCVYHLEYKHLKFKLIPFFTSNHCWQDLAMVFVRNSQKDESNSDMNECMSKYTHNADADNNYTRRSGDCIIC